MNLYFNDPIVKPVVVSLIYHDYIKKGSLTSLNVRMRIVPKDDEMQDELSK